MSTGGNGIFSTFLFTVVLMIFSFLIFFLIFFPPNDSDFAFVICFDVLTVLVVVLDRFVFTFLITIDF